MRRREFVRSAGGVLLAANTIARADSGFGPWGGLKSYSGGATPPGQPTFAQLLLQGQTQQSQAIYNAGANSGLVVSPGDLSAPSPNFQMIGWIAPSAGTFSIASYNIYRSTIANTGYSAGSYSLYANVSAATALSTYSSYASTSVSNSYPYQTGVDHAYSDTSATLCFNYPRGTGPDFYPGNGYTYKVSAVDSMGNEGALSADTIIIYFANGILLHMQGVFNGTISASDTSGGTTPLGFPKSLLWTTTQPSDLINPYCGNGCIEWGLNTRGYNYFNINIRAHQAGSMDFEPEVEGDCQLGSGGNVLALSNTAYAALVSGSWVAVKIPCTDMLTGLATSGSGAMYPVVGRQGSYYKTTCQETGSSASGHEYSMEWYWSVS